MTGGADARRLKSAVTGLLGFAAAEEHVLLAAAVPHEAGNAERWAALPLVAHNTEFKAQQVERLLAIAQGRVPAEFPEVDHTSGELYLRYAAQSPDPVRPVEECLAERPSAVAADRCPRVLASDRPSAGLLH